MQWQFVCSVPLYYLNHHTHHRLLTFFFLALPKQKEGDLPPESAELREQLDVRKELWQ